MSSLKIIEELDFNNFFHEYFENILYICQDIDNNDLANVAYMLYDYLCDICKKGQNLSKQKIFDFLEEWELFTKEEFKKWCEEQNLTIRDIWCCHYGNAYLVNANA